MSQRRLVLISDGLPSSRLEFGPHQLPVVLGRSKRADVAIPDDQLSRRHSEIGVNDQGEFLISDLDSTNLTIVNEQDVSRHILQHGDRILLGRTEIAVEIESDESNFHEQTTAEFDAVRPDESQT